MRNCPQCGRRKPDSEFRADGKSKKCAPCRRLTRVQHIRNYYRSLPRDERHRLTHRRRAQAAGVAHEAYSRSAIMERWRHLCAYCDNRAEHLDHVTPISKGGDDVERNIVPACASCNLAKGAKSLAEWAATF